MRITLLDLSNGTKELIKMTPIIRRENEYVKRIIFLTTGEGRRIEGRSTEHQQPQKYLPFRERST